MHRVLVKRKGTTPQHLLSKRHSTSDEEYMSLVWSPEVACSTEPILNFFAMRNMAGRRKVSSIKEIPK